MTVLHYLFLYPARTCGGTLYAGYMNSCVTFYVRISGYQLGNNVLAIGIGRHQYQPYFSSATSAIIYPYALGARCIE